MLWFCLIVILIIALSIETAHIVFRDWIGLFFFNLALLFGALSYYFITKLIGV